MRRLAELNFKTRDLKPKPQQSSAIATIPKPKLPQSRKPETLKRPVREAKLQKKLEMLIKRLLPWYAGRSRTYVISRTYMTVYATACGWMDGWMDGWLSVCCVNICIYIQLHTDMQTCGHAYIHAYMHTSPQCCSMRQGRAAQSARVELFWRFVLP